MVEHFPAMCLALLSIPSVNKTIVRKQREEVPCHIKLQLGCSSFVEVIGEDYLQQRAIRVTAAIAAQPRPP